MAVKCPQMNLSRFAMLLSPSPLCFKLTVMINLEQVCWRVSFCQWCTKMSQWWQVKLGNHFTLELSKHLLKLLWIAQLKMWSYVLCDVNLWTVACQKWRSDFHTCQWRTDFHQSRVLLIFIKHHFDVLQLLMVPANGLYYRILKAEITLDCVKPEPGKFAFKLSNNEMSLRAGALTLSCGIGTFVDFTLSNASGFYSV